MSAITGRLDALRFFLGLVRPYARRLLLAAAALVVSGAVALILPRFAGDVVDAAFLDKNLGRMKTIVAVLIAIFLANAVLDFLESWLLRTTSAFLVRDLRTRLHAHLLTLTPAFFETQRTGDLLSRLSADVDQVGGTLSDQLVSGLQQALVLVGAVVILVAMHAQLTGVMLLAVPPVIVAAVLFGGRFHKLSKEQQELAAQANVVAEESLSGIRTVQAFAREDHERARYREGQERVTRVARRAAATWGAFGSVVGFLAFTAITLVLWYGGTLVVSGELTPGKLTSFLLYTFSVAGAVGSLTAFWGGLEAAGGATERIREILGLQPAIADPPEPVPLGRPRGHVAFRDVSFAYPSKEAAGTLALDRVTFAAAPGECVALVGPSGAGKSTLVSLLLRFHDPASGSIEIDGTDVRRCRLRDLRAAIGLVPQDVLLFGGTIAENVRYGRLGASDDEVRAAAEAAQAHAFVSALPQGYETLVGERGVKLSAGERQRIAIARVFLADPAIVVLDEATSALDAESEHLVGKAFDLLLATRSSIVIAHRLATVRRARRVVLLERGAVRAQGTHDELYAGDALYRRLVDLQMLAVESPAG